MSHLFRAALRFFTLWKPDCYFISVLFSCFIFSIQVTICVLCSIHLSKLIDFNNDYHRQSIYLFYWCSKKNLHDLLWFFKYSELWSTLSILEFTGPHSFSKCEDDFPFSISNQCTSIWISLWENRSYQLSNSPGFYILTRK